MSINQNLAMLLTKLCGGAAPTPLPEGYYPSGLPLLLRVSPNGADTEQKWDSQGTMPLGRGLGRSPNINLSRSGSEEYRQTDMYGMWAGAHWSMLFLSVFIGFSLIRSGVKSIKARKAGTNTESGPETDAENPAD